MLGKLTKFEFKATSKIFLPLYISVFVITLINKLFLYLEGTFTWDGYREGAIGKFISIMGSLSMIAFVILIAATAFITFFLILQRFYKNLFTDEGYLMHTLPVSAKSHIGAKLITSSVWTVASILVIALAIYLLVFSKDVWEGTVWVFQNISWYAEDFQKDLGLNFYAFFSIMGVLLIIAIPAQILTFYLSIALGGLILPKHRVGGAFIGYVIISFVSQFVSSIGTGLTLTLKIEEFTNSVNASVPPNDFFYLFMGLAGAFSLAGALICYFLTSHIMTKKLNLE